MALFSDGREGYAIFINNAIQEINSLGRVVAQQRITIESHKDFAGRLRRQIIDAQSNNRGLRATIEGLKLQVADGEDELRKMRGLMNQNEALHHRLHDSEERLRFTEKRHEERLRFTEKRHEDEIEKLKADLLQEKDVRAARAIMIEDLRCENENLISERTSLLIGLNHFKKLVAEYKHEKPNKKSVVPVKKVTRKGIVTKRKKVD